ncbi:zinc ribbon domain-containing protein [Leptolyngbya sp. 7M]|uniref:zinc ribbon domain-containing protein n=1 Tax=Leptolyngbya sp. 7M TaxID=2812896 RepID=UPI001B8C252A|nr:C4-type zinc ribbon domain-containing protein [Leptolyngbya sp. 7M]QYO66607.1 hypothetical protein JVX88_07340 [Leptolyngbya sp. 7M]
MREDLEKLIELQVTDSNLRRLKRIIDTATDRRAEIEREFDQHASSIREVKDRFESLKAERVSLERQISDHNVHRERAERNLKHAQNQKEYETSMREIDTLQKQISQLETQLVDKMEAIEAVEKELEERADEINSHDLNRDDALSSFDSEVESARGEFESESAKREQMFATIGPQLAAVYNRLVQRSRDGIAVAAVVNESCSACFMSLRPQMMLEVRRMNSIVNCESCTRILYVPVEGSMAASNESVA